MRIYDWLNRRSFYSDFAVEQNNENEAICGDSAVIKHLITLAQMRDAKKARPQDETNPRAA